MALAILLLCQLGLITALQHCSVHSLSRNSYLSPNHRRRCIWSAPVDQTELTKEAPQVDYDWDEQFEELLAFQEEYLHCNFPLNAPTKLTSRYPTLARFCHNQRLEFYNRNRVGSNKMSLTVFDRRVRCRRLEEIGFEFKIRSARWFDRYHELVQYRDDNGNIYVKDYENLPLFDWIRLQRSRRKGREGIAKLSKVEIELLDNLGFEWGPNLYDKLWHAKYNELVDFRKQHGHLSVPRNGPLYYWISHQRQRRAGKTNYMISDEKIRLLDDIEFHWIPQRQKEKWIATYDALVRFEEEHGPCEMQTSRKLYMWAMHQRNRRKKGLLSKEEMQLLDKTDFAWDKPKSWHQMYGELIEYIVKHDHLNVSHEDDPELYDWMKFQRQRYQGRVEPALSGDKIEQLDQILFPWSLDWRDRTWHEKFMEIVEFFKEHGHVRVIEQDNPSLYNWIQVQGKRYKEAKGQKPISKEELELLEQIDLPFLENQPRMAWNAMYADLVRYRTKNKGSLPSHKDDPDMNRWIRQQRNRHRSGFGYTPLSMEQLSLLEKIDFPMMHQAHRTRSWYEKYDELVSFAKKHGHFVIGKSENAKLGRWVERQRVRYKGLYLNNSRMLKSEIYLLDRIGFPWASDRSEVEWQMNYDELVQVLEENGVQLDELRQESFRLYKWLLNQRSRYNGKEIPDHQIKQLENINGFRWSGKW